MGITSQRALAYSEVYEILNMMDEKYLKKIPDKLKKIIIEEKDDEYKPMIRNDIPLKEQKLQNKTFTILAIINLNYWCESDEHKKKLLDIYKTNEKNKEKKLREKYNPDNVFKNKRQKDKIENQNDSLLIIKKESFFKKIILKIKKFF